MRHAQGVTEVGVVLTVSGMGYELEPARDPTEWVGDDEQGM